MMINKRLINTIPKSKKYIAGNVAMQWISLAANICMMLSITNLLEELYEKTASTSTFLFVGTIVIIAIIIRFCCTIAGAKMSFQSSKSVKETLRCRIYEKLLRLGSDYQKHVSTSQVIQVTVEGVDQLETYFASYLPQFFYSLLAPFTLFITLCFINVSIALVLLVCVPLIPIAIAAVQTFAKKLLAKYWDQYTTLGDTFLENLQGLTTLKIYQADEQKAKEMDAESEAFRKITMKVLSMQLNSITIMDIIAYGGAALGVILAVTQYQNGTITLAGGLAVILLAADFFIPMRLLGSFFHIAMNGMAASDKIFQILDIKEDEHHGSQLFPQNEAIRCEDVCFSYEMDREIIRDVSLHFPKGSFSAIVGESGSGKSTIASLLTGHHRYQSGHISIGDIPLQNISQKSIAQNITYVGFDSYIFKGSVEENLRMGNEVATQSQLWEVLERVQLAAFLRSEQGLATPLLEKGANFSGGQRQRLALARAILHNSPIYIFDEATSNVDVESEQAIMTQIYELAKTKTVILITHRLANAIPAAAIYVMQEGRVTERGNHEQLINTRGLYAQLWDTQSCLEQEVTI